MAMTLAEVEAKIETLLESPETDYQIGSKRVNASQKLDQLLKYREHLMKHPGTSDADLQTLNFNMNVNEFGEETGEYED